MTENNIDLSYPSADQQLIWRLDDLKERYSELLEKEAPCCGDDYFSWDDYRYAPPECFETLRDIARAIEVAEECMMEKYEVNSSDITMLKDDEEDINQISLFCFFDFTYLFTQDVA